MMFLLEYVPLTQMAVNPGGRPEGNLVSPGRQIADTLEQLHAVGQLPSPGRETVPTKVRTRLNHLHPGNMFDFGPCIDGYCFTWRCFKAYRYGLLLSVCLLKTWPIREISEGDKLVSIKETSSTGFKVWGLLPIKVSMPPKKTIEINLWIILMSNVDVYDERICIDKMNRVLCIQHWVNLQLTH